MLYALNMIPSKSIKGQHQIIIASVNQTTIAIPAPSP